uniref:leucine-rich repeat and IQ domain-containing protein 1 n=1 Tax=Monopterus albus TaxID=43700 RepID=UPI0009B33537|nr:leucine-rich repeat and IQ domain-containing protein 1 [Monopterus albus]
MTDVDEATDDIPPSLLRYFEASKSRAAVCEKLILQEPEDFTEDIMDLPFGLEKDTMNLNEQIISETENEENNTSTDTSLLPAPTEREALFTHNVAACLNNEDEAETDKYMKSETHLACKVRILKSSLKEVEVKESGKFHRERREKQQCEEVKKQEQQRQREKDFQEDLKKIMEAEKLHQKEIELLEKRAQEKLQQQLLLQQERISNLQKQVEEERRMSKEEQMRIKEEEEKKKKAEEEEKKREEKNGRKWVEEKIEREMEKERMKEEITKIKEVRLKEEVERRNKEEEPWKKEEEEEQRREERAEKRKSEEDNNKIEEQMRKKEGEMEEEERKKKKKEDNIKEKAMNEEREEETSKGEMEGNKKSKHEEVTFEDEWEEEEKRREQELRITKEIKVRTLQEKMTKKADQKKSEEERRKVEKMMDEQVRRNKEENQKTEDELQLKEDKERRRNHVERRLSREDKDMIRKEEEKKIKEEEQTKRQKEEMRQSEEERCKKMAEARLKEEEGNKAHEAENQKVEHEKQTKDKERGQEEEKTKVSNNCMRKREDVGINIEADKRQIKEEVRENKEERRLKEEEESKNIMVQGTKNEEGLRRASELQEKKRESSSMKTLNERKRTDSTGHSLTSHLEDKATPGPLHAESTASPTSSGTVQQHDLDENISEVSTYKSMDKQDAAEKPCTSFGSLPVCLPEHTEQKRLSWMKDCIPWSRLSLQSRRRQKSCVCSRRGLRRAAEADGLPSLSPHTLLQATGWKSLQEVTSVTLEDLPGCNLSTLVQCTQLRSLTLRRCGLRSLEGIKQLPVLCYIDVQDNDISFVDCENMTGLRVLRLGHNKLTSIHGLSGADNLDVLDLSHNAITRIAGLESLRRLQRLSVDHNQLISTKGLRDVYTLLQLNCSHNHLASLEGIDNSPLLNTLDLRANSLTEPPSLNNHVLLRELNLDDNSISSLQGLTACWLPLLQHLSVAQNRITQLPSMPHFVSLANLDLRFNCMSELQNVCESLEGCHFLQDVHLTKGASDKIVVISTLQKALPGLRATDDQETDSFLTPPTVHQVGLASVSFLSFCQAQLQQTRDLQERHSRELSNASSSLEAVESSCRHFAETLKLAEDQRYAHEYGDITASAGQTMPEETVDVDSTNAEMLTQHSEMESNKKVNPSWDNFRCSSWTKEEKLSTESWHDTLDIVTTVPETGLRSLDTEGQTFSSDFEMTAGYNHQNLNLRNSKAAVLIQQRWREYRQKCGNISSPPAAEKGPIRGGDGGKPESGPFYSNRSIENYAATVIQALWRGFALRRRLASALAAVTCPNTTEDDTFEEVDEFVFDGAALDKSWTLRFSADSPCSEQHASDLPLSMKPPGPFPEPSQYTLSPPLVRRSKQAWLAGEQVASAGRRIPPESSSRSKSPAATSVLSAFSERSKTILEEWGFSDSRTALLMIKRAQKMKSKQQQKECRDPLVRLALFRNCSYPLGPVEEQKRHAPQNRNYMKVCRAEPGEMMEQVKQAQVQHWLHTQSDRDSESEHFLPEISSEILNGARVQLVAAPWSKERHHASGLWASSSLAVQPSTKDKYPRRNSLGHARKDVSSPKRVTSAPPKKERISFRDNPVQLSGGWGGGKKRDKVHNCGLKWTCLSI